jgi:hypothetical protein
MHFAKYSVFKTFFLLLCLCMAAASFAQGEQVPDTTYLPTPTQEDDDGTGTKTTANVYLVEKWMPEASIDSLHFGLRQLPDSLLQRFRRDPDFWYADSVFKRDSGTIKERESSVNSTPKPERKRKPPSSSQRSESRSSSGSMGMQSLLWIIIIVGGLALIFIILASRNVNLFSKKKKEIAATDVSMEETTDIFAIKYISEIDKAAMAGNYRLAIRLMFLRLLKAMAERNIIQYKHDRTNFDYLVQLSSTPYYEEFFRITRHYEYSWYGKFDVSPSAYDVIKNEFDSFEAKVK